MVWPIYFFGRPRNGRTRSLPLTCFKLTPDLLVPLAFRIGLFLGIPAEPVRPGVGRGLAQ